MLCDYITTDDSLRKRVFKDIGSLLSTRAEEMSFFLFVDHLRVATEMAWKRIVIERRKYGDHQIDRDNFKSRPQTQNREMASRKKYTTPDNYCFITVDRMPLSTHHSGAVINLFDCAANYNHKQRQRLSNDIWNSQWTHNSLMSDFISFIDLKKNDKSFYESSKKWTKNAFLVLTNWPMSTNKLRFIIFFGKMQINNTKVNAC